MVSAYKSLLKEKEALEAALSSNPSGNIENETTSGNQQQKTNSTEASTSYQQQGPSDDDLKLQISTVMNSLATLSAEKSKMEASFQADKRHLRQELHEKDRVIKELQDKLRASQEKFNLELEKAKSKLIVERHEREKETNDHMLMVRELQKLLSDERHLKDNIEMQLNDLKAQFAQSGNSDVRIKELTTELDQVKQKIREFTKPSKQPQNELKSDSVLRHLQSEIVSLKQQHAIAIRTEQKRAQQAEEQYRKLSAVHEDRVANLESRLAELSATVGTYDRMRQLDQENIFKLKEKIAQFELGSTIGMPGPSHSTETTDDIVQSKYDVDNLIDEIIQLKKVLLVENAKLSTPKDLSQIFSPSNDHYDCLEIQEKLRTDFEQYKRNHKTNNETIETQQNHIKNLQNKIQVLNRNIDEQEQELKNKSGEYAMEIKMERQKWKDLIGSMEMDFRGKVAELEQQLQKQRERSLGLLEEKENEIKSLKASFEVFIPNGGDSAGILHSADAPGHRKTSQESQQKMHLGSVLNSTGNGQQSSEYHMLHYVHELSRKEVEIVTLRKARHAAESALRQALQDKVTSQEELHDRIIMLEETVDR